MNTENRLKELIKKQYIILDGAMGTEIQKKNIDDASWIYDNKNVEGCNEVLCITNPDILESIYLEYLHASVNIITTNSFGAIPWVLSEYGLENDVELIASKSVEIVKNSIEKYRKETNSNRDIFIAGSLGPGVKLPSLGQIGFDEMSEGYTVAIKALIDSGVDILLFETAQDILQLKSAIITARTIDTSIPIMVSVTIEKEGTMLLGTDIETACTTLASLPIFSLGVNCGTGPDIAIKHLVRLSKLTHLPISIHSNAGIPKNVDGKAYYSMTPDEFASINFEASEISGVAILGGCCGAAPAHIKALSDSLENKIPIPPVNQTSPKYISSLFTISALKQTPAPMLIGERINASGSRVFRNMILENDYDAILDFGIKESKMCSHALDLNVAWVGRDEMEEMKKIVSIYTKQITTPLVIDTTKPEIMEEALKRYGGKPILNSVNFEQGEANFDLICSIAKKYGTALICLTIDEEGMAQTSERKVSIAKRIFERATEIHKIEPHNIIFDPLTFTLASGEESSFSLATETLNSIKEISRLYKDSSISLGVSNISYGLKEEARIVMNALFLNEAVKCGLTAAILNTAQIMPLNKISEKEKELALKLIYNEEKTKDALFDYINYFSNKKETVSSNTTTIIKKPLPISIKEAMIDGKWSEMSGLLIEAKDYKDFGGENNFASYILNKILLPTMAEIGGLFASGAMQLPFVLGSAEIMKKSVDYLSKFMPQKNQEKQVTIILGTVAGDVHDVGKNLVDILLTNNGYKVVNIGTKANIEKFIDEYKKHNADFIGMSGLLVKSTEIMKENLIILKKQNLNVPILLGGAALTKEFVEKNCREAYENIAPVFYCRDGFDSIEAIKNTPLN